MSGYNIKDFVKDFADRTIANYEVIYQLQNKSERKKVYEVTQLINSMLGVIVVPVEMMENDPTDDYIKLIAWDSYSIVKDILKRCKAEKRYFSDYRNDNILSVWNFSRHLRNSVAHSGNQGIQFYPINDNGMIECIVFYDRYEKNGITYNEFCVKLDVEELCELVFAYADIFSKLEKNYFKIPRYYERFDKISKLLESGKRENENKSIFD